MHCSALSQIRELREVAFLPTTVDLFNAKFCIEMHSVQGLLLVCAVFLRTSSAGLPEPAGDCSPLELP